MKHSVQSCSLFLSSIRRELVLSPAAEPEISDLTLSQHPGSLYLERELGTGEFNNFETIPDELGDILRSWAIALINRGPVMQFANDTHDVE
jgi:hypothetical protein